MLYYDMLIDAEILGYYPKNGDFGHITYLSITSCWECHKQSFVET